MIGKLATRVLLFGGSAIAMAQPAVTVKSLIDEEPRVYLVPPTSPEFAKAVAASPYDIVRQVPPLYPYSAAMVNDTDQDAFAYAVSWKGNDAAGKEISHTFETGSVYTLPFAPSDIRAHSVGVLLPRMGGADVVASRRPEKVQEALGKQLAYLNRYRSMTVTLDVVLFRDGLAVGPDPGHCIPRWKARPDATREIAELVRGKTDAEAKAGLEAIVSEALKRPGAHLAGGGAASTYEEAIVLERAHVANTELAFMKLNGEAELSAFKARTKDLAFPQVHRLKLNRQEEQK
ncbi:MAG TPA: hypothetical protein VH639_18970 [Bryobacteraceae bacterium]|jgi:hypothetical protein